MEKVWASLLLCAVALTFVPVGLAQDYTLQNLYREAVKNSEKIKYAEEGSFENLRQTALNDRTDLRSYDMQIQVAERQVKYARGAFWPYVSFFAITTARIKAPRRRPSFGKACWPVSS
ncbi:MAG: TolC family protein, partial [Smithellaceae bacterium]|nr:TolC family protein [Smithellaceae bacterium]